MRKRQAFDVLDEQVSDLKKIVSLLEWDIPRMKNSEFRARKEAKLEELRNELCRLEEAALQQTIFIREEVNNMAKRGRKRKTEEVKTEEAAE